MKQTQKTLSNPLAKRNQGFTLIEMMIVIVLIGFVATFAGVNIMRRFDEAKINSTKIQIKSLMTVLDEFRRVCGFYPLTDQRLDSLISRPAGGRECKNYPPEGILNSKQVPKDAWSNDFDYASDGQKFVIRSFGADNAEGGEGTDGDISSEDL